MNIYRNAINSAARIDKMIIACLRNSSDCQQEIDRVNLPYFDWHLFLKKVFAEGVDGLLFDNLSKWGFVKKIPDWAWLEIKQNYMRNLGRNLLITTHLDNLVQALEADQIAGLLLRGGDFLNRRTYPLASRSMSDIDLVIHQEDIGKVENLLENLGYQHPKGYRYLFDNKALFIDLHIDYIGSYKFARNPYSQSLKNKEIWLEAIALKSNSVYVKSLSIYDAVICCCAHLQEHSFSRLIWFYDIRNLINNAGNDFNWAKLVLKSRQYGLAKTVFYVLKYLDTNRILAVPQNVIKELACLRLNSFEKRSLEMLLRDRRSDVSGELLYLFSKKGFITKLRCLGQAIFIDRASFHLAVEKITLWHYIQRFFAMSLYGIRKMFKLMSI